MTIEPAGIRARQVYSTNKYFVLATQDDDGPWAAALAFTFVQPNGLYFFSRRTSRHGLALAAGGNVAGVIYNSQCTFEEVESIQFSGTGGLAHDRETIRLVLNAGRPSGSPPVSDQDIEAEFSKSGTGLFRVTVERAWVLDQRAFQDEGIDAREEFDVSQMFASVES